MFRRLDRLQAANMNNRGVQTWSQRVCEQIETAFDDLDAQIADIAAALAAATAAQTAAAAAAAEATAVKTTDKISASATG
jgi:hypothetical protein